MALTQFETDTLKEMHAKCLRDLGSADATKRATAKTEIDTIVTGDEAARQALIASWITATGIPDVDTQIAACNAQLTALTAKKAAMEAY